VTPAPAPAIRQAAPTPTAAEPRAGDVTAPPWRQATSPQSAEPAASVPSALPPAAGAARSASRAASAPSTPAEPLPSEAQVLDDVRAQAQQLATAPPVRLVPAAPPSTPSSSVASAPRAPTAAPAASTSPTRPASDAASPGTPAPNTAAAVPERSAAFIEAQAKRTAQRIAAADTRSLGPAVPVIRSEGQGLRFKWPDPVTAAAFTRGPYVFLIFNKRAPLDLAGIRTAPADDLVGGVTTVPSEGTAVRLTPPPGTFFAMRAEGNEWIIEMTRRPRVPDVPTRIMTRNEGEPATARVMVALRGGEAVLRFQDPEVGDELRVVPTAIAGEGIEDERDFPQFNILASAQGLIVKPETDGLIVRSLGQMVEIYAPGGTLLSLPDDTPGKADTENDADGQPRLFNFTEWRRDDGRPYLERLRELELRSASLAPNERNPARLALARFLFSNGHAVEADGVLETMAQLQPALVNTRLFHALKGAAALTVGNLDDAAAHLRHASLDRDPEIAMWRAALAMAEGNVRSAIEQISRGPDLTRRYPPPYANRLGLAIAEALVEIGDIPAARDRIEAVLINDPTPSEEGQARYLRGRLALTEGKPDDAIAIWSALERGTPSPARVLATLALVEFQLKENRITPTQAIERIEKLRYIWRGDALEFAVLRRLGELELATGEVRNGLERLRDLIALNPQSREVSAVTRQMSAAFQKFFLEGEADKLSPIAAIGLFNEFRNLVPQGQSGDKMMRNLADRLIKVDLLDQAADLLDYQIKNRLDGEAKAEAGARLAFTRLLDNKPNDAITALKDTDLPDLPIELIRDRDRLGARALADLERPADALKQIAQDLSPEADVLRSEINWKTGKWAAAAEALGRLAGDPPGGTTPLSEEESRRILRYSAALALAGDQTGLDVARAKYGPAMARGTYKDIFTVMASDRAGPMLDVRDVTARLSSTAPFETFLTAYREKLVNPPPAAGG
jgi:tetratricopeptide (TPR) repeat protein